MNVAIDSKTISSVFFNVICLSCLKSILLLICFTASVQSYSAMICFEVFVRVVLGVI